MQKAINTYLRFTTLRKTVFWDFYSLSNKNSIQSKYPIVPLNEVLTQRKGSIVIDDSLMYKRCRVQVQAKGVILRDEVIGKEIKTKKQQLCKTDDFLVAEIDAKVGGYGIVPPELENAIVSGHYFLFEIDQSKLLPEFLGIVVKQNDFAKQIKSTGSTNYAAIRPYHVLEYLIPLPTIAEQKRIVKSYQNKIDDAERLEKEAKGLDGDIERYFYEEIGLRKIKDKAIKGVLNTVRFSNLNRWDSIFENTFKSKFPIEKIGNFITEISTGTTPPTNRSEYFINEVNFYTPSDIGNEMYLLKSERGVSMLAIKDKKARRFDKGTFLFVGIGSTVGKIGIVGNEFATSNQQITGFKVDEDVFFNEYVYLYFLLCKEFTIKEQTKATLPIVNQSKILNIPIPIPPISIQKIIAKKILSKQAKIATLKGESLKYKRLAFVEFEKEIFT